MWRAVFPFLVAASTIAPRLSNSCTTSTCPSLAARCSALRPFCVGLKKKHMHTCEWLMPQRREDWSEINQRAYAHKLQRYITIGKKCQWLTEFDVFMSRIVPLSKYSCILSNWPALAAFRNAVFGSCCKKKKILLLAHAIGINKRVTNANNLMIHHGATLWCILR